jgi:hypothetical protein
MATNELEAKNNFLTIVFSLSLTITVTPANSIYLGTEEKAVLSAWCAI